MRNPSDEWDELRRKVLGLGDSSMRKTHYPALQARLQELERFRRVVDISSDLLFVVHYPAGAILDVSAACCERLGVSREYLLGKSFSDLICAGKREATVRELERLYSEATHNGLVTTELECNHPGGCLPVEIAARALEVENSNIAVFAARDITERQKSEQRILKLNRLYRVITEVNKTIVKTQDRDSLFQEVCRLCVEFGDFRAARIALFCGDLLLPAASAGDSSLLCSAEYNRGDHPCMEATLAGWEYVCNQLGYDTPCQAEAFRKGYNAACAVPLRFRGTSIGVLSLYSQTAGLFDQDEVELLQGVASDISFALELLASEEERRKAEQSRKETLQKIEAIFEASPAAITAMDARAEVIAWNQAAERVFGWAAEDIIGQPYPMIVPEHLMPEYYDIKARVYGGESYYGESKRCRKDGAEFDVSISIVPLKDEHGAVIGGIGVYTDISEQKRMHAQLLQSSKLESIGRLAGGIAHDFNNLLTVINGHAELVLSRLSRAHKLRGSATEILKAGQRAAELTRQLLAFSRAQVLQPKVLPVNGVILEMEDMLRRLIGEDVIFTARLEPECGAVKADGSQLQQVIMNLVVNARDAVHAGGSITISTGQVAHPKFAGSSVPDPGEYVTISVTDDGIGMDEETQRHIFEPFFTTKPVGKGTGLGLSTVWGIVKQSGGHISLKSEMYRGTTFTIYLPRVGISAVADQEVETDTLPRGTETLLLVEDRQDVRLLTAQILRGYGYHVLEADSPRSAFAVWKIHGPAIQLVISDVAMPEMSGPEMAERLREICPEVKILYVSGHGRTSVLDPKAAFLEKPYPPNSLARAVHSLLHPTTEQVA
jgi:PAS domain S-box-containing protein